MDMYQAETFLQHYGIPGMKWGIRRENPRGKTHSEVASTLTNAELKKRVDRLNLEKRYVDLASGKEERDRTTMERGKAAVKTALSNAGQQTLNETTKKAMGISLNIAGMIAADYIDKKGPGIAKKFVDITKKK